MRLDEVEGTLSMMTMLVLWFTGNAVSLTFTRLHQEAKKVNPAIIGKYLRTRVSQRQQDWMLTWRSLLSERTLILSSVTLAIDGIPSPGSRVRYVVCSARCRQSASHILSTLDTLWDSFFTRSRSLKTSSLASVDSHSPWQWNIALFQVAENSPVAFSMHVTLGD